MTILEVPINTPAVLERIDGEDQFVRRLHDLGFYPGCHLQMKHRLGKNGAVVVALEATSFALRKSEAARLIVRLANA